MIAVHLMAVWEGFVQYIATAGLRPELEQISDEVETRFEVSPQ